MATEQELQKAVFGGESSMGALGAQFSALWVGGPRSGREGTRGAGVRRTGGVAGDGHKTECSDDGKPANGSAGEAGRHVDVAESGSCAPLVAARGAGRR